MNSTTLTVGSLFSGIGGIDLGLERAGMCVAWQSEIDPYASKVLAKHWPDTPNLGDITLIDWNEVPRVDVIAGGYPCQPFSLAGVRRGDTDPRHLWPHFHRAVRHLRPRYALMENVPGHLSMGFDRVLGDLAEIGYDVEWCSIPAAAVGAPHLRWRIFAVAHPHGESEPVLAVDAVTRPGVMVPDAGSARRRQDSRSTPSNEGSDAGRATQHDHVARSDGEERDVADADRSRLALIQGGETFTGGTGIRAAGDPGWWAVEPDVGRVAHGVPRRVDRLRCLGNAVVPAVAELVGGWIVDAAA